MNATRRMLALSGTALMLLAGCAPGTMADDAKNLVTKLAHHDHTSRRGGMVIMDGDTHFEVIVDFGGKHQVLFSDAYRKPLPARAIEEVTFTVLRTGAPAEILTLSPDGSEEGTWSAFGSAIAEKDVNVEVSYRRSGSQTPYSIELPASAPATPAHAHAH